MNQKRAEPFGITIRLFLADADPSGLILIDRLGWIGQALVCSRAQFPSIKPKRTELQRTSVYVLDGLSDDLSRQRVYVGEADNAGDRVASHIGEKDFWNRLVVFTATDSNFNKAHARYIEARLISLARDAKTAELDNGTAPDPDALALSEPEKAYAEAFLAEMLRIFPLVKVNAFEVAESGASQQGVGSVTLAAPLLVLARKGVSAPWRDEPRGFIVYRRSTAVPDSKVAPATPGLARQHRTKLQQSGVLRINEDHVLEFTQDFVFSSPSTAAETILGASANGRIEWKSDDGRTLKQIQSDLLIAPKS